MPSLLTVAAVMLPLPKPVKKAGTWEVPVEDGEGIREHMTQTCKDGTLSWVDKYVSMFVDPHDAIASMSFQEYVNYSTSFACLVHVTDPVCIHRQLDRLERGVPSLGNNAVRNGAVVDRARVTSKGYIVRCLCGDYMLRRLCVHVVAWLLFHDLIEYPAIFDPTPCLHLHGRPQKFHAGEALERDAQHCRETGEVSVKLRRALTAQDAEITPASRASLSLAHQEQAESMSWSNKAAGASHKKAACATTVRANGASLTGGASLTSPRPAQTSVRAGSRQTPRKLGVGDSAQRRRDKTSHLSVPLRAQSAIRKHLSQALNGTRVRVIKGKSTSGAAARLVFTPKPKSGKKGKPKSGKSSGVAPDTTKVDRHTPKSGKASGAAPDKTKVDRHTPKNRTDQSSLKKKGRWALETASDDEILLSPVMRPGPLRATVDPAVEHSICVRLENMYKQEWMQIRANMPQVEVRPSTIEHPKADRGLFNASGHSMCAGTFVQVLSFGRRFTRMGSHCVLVAGNCHQKYKQTPAENGWAADVCKGLLGGSANEGDAKHANNCVIVEMPIGVSSAVAQGATFIVTVQDVPAGAEYLVHYGNDTTWSFRSHGQSALSPAPRDTSALSPAPRDADHAGQNPNVV